MTATCRLPAILAVGVDGYSRLTGEKNAVLRDYAWRLNAFDLAGNHFVEPSPPLGDGG